jgi:SAM-dependent methyltransferase
MVPEPLKRKVEGGYHALRSRAEMAALKREYRRRYGPGLVYRVDDRDEMMRFTREFWEWRHHLRPMQAPSDALYTYLVAGDRMTGEVEGVLRDHGRELARLDSFLEFACGYGRFTRFLVTRLDPSRVTVADIDPAAVDFVRETFGVSGFYSTQSADDLGDQGPFEVVFVASLFSHLGIEHWRAWLQRLYRLLAPGGLLILSTHGDHMRNDIYGPEQRKQLREDADGFCFIPTNETKGRLELEYYGSALVTEDFVRREVAALGLGTLTRFYPIGLWGQQDLSVVAKPAAGG